MSYKFSREIYEEMSAGSFRAFAKERYPHIKPRELAELVDRYYGEEKKEAHGLIEVDTEREEPITEE